MARIFLCHASEDKAQVRGVYQKLKAIDGFEPWLDEEEIFPGQVWEQEIPRALKNSAFVLVFLSQHSVAKRGYVQREMKRALDILQEMPEGMIHTILVRLDGCDAPTQFRRYHYANLFEARGFKQLVQTIQAGITQRQSRKSDTAPGGAVDEHLYITRQVDHEVLTQIRRDCAMVTLQGPRRSGKTSLILRLRSILHAEHQFRVVIIDFRRFMRRDLQSTQQLWRAIAGVIVKQLEIEDWDITPDIEQPLPRRNLINLAHFLSKQPKDFDLHLIETFNEVMNLILHD